MALGAWLALSGDERPEHAENEDDSAEEAPAKVAAPAEPLRSAPRPRPSAAPRASAAATDDLNVVGAHPDDPHLPGMHPHPFTPEHERIFAENRTIQSLNDAMSFRDTKKMRALLLEYEKIDPTDVHKNQVGYSIIADCIDFPGDASLATAHQFYDTERHSSLRRFVRRICFENSN